MGPLASGLFADRFPTNWLDGTCDQYVASEEKPPPEPYAQLQLPPGALVKRLRILLQRVRQVRRLIPHTHRTRLDAAP
jgi:hypothetical protein